jgi:hypothetical protein
MPMVAVNVGRPPTVVGFALEVTVVVVVAVGTSTETVVAVDVTEV